MAKKYISVSSSTCHQNTVTLFLCNYLFVFVLQVFPSNSFLTATSLMSESLKSTFDWLNRLALSCGVSLFSLPFCWKPKKKHRNYTQLNCIHTGHKQFWNTQVHIRSKPHTHLLQVVTKVKIWNCFLFFCLIYLIVNKDRSKIEKKTESGQDAKRVWFTSTFWWARFKSTVAQMWDT